AVGSGQSVLVQVEDSAAGPTTRGIGAQSITTRASQTFEEAISRVRPAAEAIVDQLRSLSAAPDEVQVEFGLTLSAQGGDVAPAAGREATSRLRLGGHGPGEKQPSCRGKSGVSPPISSPTRPKSLSNIGLPANEL